MIYAITLILLVFALPGAAAPACGPELTDLFAPRRPQLGHYEVCVVDEPLAAVGAAGAADGWHYAAVERLEVLDAFGTAGAYDRARMAQLYGGRRVEVRRGWRQRGDEFESVTLLSPYPDTTLSRLNPGTMTIRWTLEEYERKKFVTVSPR